MIGIIQRRTWSLGWSALAALGMLACTESVRDRQVTGPERQLMTASDSAAFLAQRGSGASPQSPSEGVPIRAGESAVMTIISAECASIGSVLSVSGALSGTTASQRSGERIAGAIPTWTSINPYPPRTSRLTS